jgi:hypothetical protein
LPIGFYPCVFIFLQIPFPGSSLFSQPSALPGVSPPPAVFLEGLPAGFSEGQAHPCKASSCE